MKKMLCKIVIIFITFLMISTTVFAAGEPNWITINQSDFDNSELVIKQEGLSGFGHGGPENTSNPGWYRFWRKVPAGQTQVFEYSNVGWYNGNPIGARVTVSPSQGFLYVDTIFENGYMAASQDHMRAGNYASQLKGSIKYEYYYMSDSSKAAINLSDALFTICSNSGDEYIANLSNNSAPVYRSSDSELKWKENGGNTYVGNVTSQHWDDFNSPTLAKTTAGWIYSGTSFTIGYWGDQSRGYFFAPSTYKFNLNEGYAKVKYVDVTGGNEVELSQTGVFKGSSAIKVLSKYTNYNNDLNSYLSRGYAKVSSELDGNPSFTNGTSIHNPKVYVVKLQHKITDIPESKTVTRTINYYKNNTSGGKLFDSKVQSQTFNRTNKKDEVTGTISYGTWSPANKDFAAVNNPTHDEWYTDDANVAKITVTQASSNSVINIIYKQYQYAKVIYLDETRNNELLEESARMKGKQNANINYDATDRISLYEDLGYKLVRNEISTTKQFDNNSSVDQEFKVILKHTYTTVDKNTYEKDKCLNNACTKTQAEKGC